MRPGSPRPNPSSHTILLQQTVYGDPIIRRVQNQALLAWINRYVLVVEPDEATATHCAEGTSIGLDEQGLRSCQHAQAREALGVLLPPTRGLDLGRQRLLPTV